MAYNPGTAHYPEIQSYRMWWDAVSPILNYTPVVCIYTSYNITRIKYAYLHIYIYINTELLDGNKGHQEETHHPTQRFRRLFLDLLSMGWRGCASAMGAIKLPSSCWSPKLISKSIIQYNICSKEDFAISDFKLHNCVIVAIECLALIKCTYVSWFWGCLTKQWVFDIVYDRYIC